MTECPMCAEEISEHDVTCVHCGSRTHIERLPTPATVALPVSTGPVPSTQGPALQRKAGGKRRGTIFVATASMAIACAVAATVLVVRKHRPTQLEKAQAYFDEWIGQSYCEGQSDCSMYGCSTFMLSDGVIASSTCTVTQDGFSSIIGINYNTASERMKGVIFALLGPPQDKNMQPMMTTAFHFAKRFGDQRIGAHGIARWASIPIALGEIYRQCNNVAKRGWSLTFSRDSVGVDMNAECNDLGTGWVASVEMVPLDADDVGHRRPRADGSAAAVTTATRQSIPPPASPDGGASKAAALEPPIPQPLASAASAAPAVSLRVDDVERSLAAQLQSFLDAHAFVGAFDDHAIAFFPSSLQSYEGRMQIANGFRDAWDGFDNYDKITPSPVTVGISGPVAWATTTWTITLAGKPALPLRVTEVLHHGATGIQVIAASFSVPPARGATGITDPIPSFAGGIPGGGGPEAWLASPPELSKHLLDDAMDDTMRNAASLIGSDANEKAVGVEAIRKLLMGWGKLKLERVGNVRVIDGDGYKVVLEFARWREPKPTTFRVLGVFVQGTGMVGDAPWQLASAQYSVAVSNVMRTAASSAPVPGARPPEPIGASIPPPARAPAQVLMMSRDHILFEAWEGGAEVLHGGSTLEVLPGTPRTVTLKAKPLGYKDKTITVDGTKLQIDFTLEPAPDCLGTLVDPKSADCRTQYCANHKTDLKCGIE